MKSNIRISELSLLGEKNTLGALLNDNSQHRLMAPVYVGSEIYRRAAFGSHHPLNIVRHAAVLDIVTALGWLPAEQFHDTTQASVSELLEFHDPDYVAALQYADSEGRVSPEVREKYAIGTMENPVFEGLFERAAMTVGGSIAAARLALAGHVAFHPSGGTHHGRADRASGFCYFNDPVFALRTMLHAGRERLLYLDLDAHHGDGVEAAFVDDDRVTTISIHEENRWPYSGKAGEGLSHGAYNLPVPKGFNDSELEFLVDAVVLPLIEMQAVDGMVICCGADCLAGDPLSGMMLSNVALWQTLQRVMQPGVATVVLGGGGYNPWTVARYWSGMWATLIGADIPTSLPPVVQDVLAAMECDLIDEEDVEPEWLTTIADSAYRGEIRQSVTSLPSFVLPPTRRSHGVA